MSSTTLSAEILSVGTELLLGDIINTDAAYISKRLAEVGIPMYRQSVVGDNADRLRDAVRECLGRCDILFMTGGLGPTCDDITKKVTAEVFGLELYLDTAVVASMEEYFSDIGRPMTGNNLSQAMLPEGAVVLENRNGTAPGVLIEGTIDNSDAKKTVVMLPGPPHELVPMFSESVMPYLRVRSPYTIYSLNLHLYNIGESRAEHILRDIMETSTNPTVAPYACEAEVRLRITARGNSKEECIELCRRKAEEIRRTEASQYIFAESTSESESSETLVRMVIDTLREKGLTVGTAESCTAGMISARIGDIPGSSDVLYGGVVSYANEVKTGVLGVPEEVLREHGAVSEECAAAMAEGARRVLGCDVAVSVTGVAGPGGGTPEKPVGTVCFGISDSRGTSALTRHFGSHSNRGKVRRLTVSAALMDILSRINQY